MIKKFFSKILVTIKLLWFSLFYSMESANKMILSQSSGDNDAMIQQTIKGGGGPINDMLEQRVTKEVEELREKHYRILKEADKYDTSTIKMTFDEDGNPIFTADRLHKKSKSDFMKHCDVLNENDLKIRTIQDNKKFEKKGSILNYDETTKDLHIPNGLYDYDTTLEIERDGILPRFEIEKFVTKIVVKEYMEDNSRVIVDFYIPTMASQFGKIDAIFVSNMHTMFETKNFRSDILDFKTIKWYSDKAWNSTDLCLFEYDDIKPISMNVFDGSFVISFDCHVVNDGKYIPQKYMTKEMDEKYETLAPKSNAADLFAGLRRNEALKEKEDKEKINLETTIIKLNENSN